MEDQLVTIATFNFNTDIRITLLASALESEDIPYHLKDENTLALDPLLSLAVGGVKLQVLEKNAARALELYQEIENSKPAPEDMDAEDLRWEAEKQRAEIDYRNNRPKRIAAAVFAIVALIIVLIFRLFRH